MKDTFEILACPNEDIVKDSFTNYFEDKTDINLINLIKSSLAFAICFTPLEEIGLTFKELDDYVYGFYTNGIITINKKILVNAENEEVLPKIFYAIFHELCHAILSSRNLNVIQERLHSELFVPQFDKKQIYKIMISITNSKELSDAAVNYFYLQNKNEKIAFYQGASMATEFLNYFAPDKNFYVVPGEEFLKNETKILYKKYPFLKGKEQYLYDLLEAYQISLLKKGIKKLSMEEKVSFCTSTFVSFSKKVKTILLDECYKAKDLMISATLLANPMVVLTDKEKKTLSEIYGKETIDELTYSESNLTKGN